MKSHRLLQVPENLQRCCQSIMGCVCDQPCKSPKVGSTFSRAPQTLRRSRTIVSGWPVCCLVDLFQGLRRVFKPDHLTYSYKPGRYVTGRCCQCVTLAPLTCFGRGWKTQLQRQTLQQKQRQTSNPKDLLQYLLQSPTSPQSPTARSYMPFNWFDNGDEIFWDNPSRFFQNIFKF